MKNFSSGVFEQKQITILRKITMNFFFKSHLFALLLVSVVGLVGCGKAPVAEQSAGEQADSVKKDVSAAVEKFLNAVRSGSDEEIYMMLSPKAREVCGKDRLPSMPASDTAEFRIDTIQFVSDSEAQVSTTMFDLDQTGQKMEDTLAWALRNTEEGWRIVGTAFVFIEGMEPVIVNFESREAIAEAEALVESQQKTMAAQFQQMNETKNR